MAGGDGVETEQKGPVQEPVELQVRIARNARVRGQALRVPGHVRLDYVAVEIAGEVEHVVGDAELLRYPPGVLHIRHRAATRVRRAAPQLHRGPDDLVAFLEHQGGGH